MRIINNYNISYEVLGIIILQPYKTDLCDDDRIIFLLENGLEVNSKEVKVIDNRIPLDWHLNIFRNGYYVIIGFKELTYSIDLIDWDRGGNGKAGELMRLYIKNVKEKKWGEELEYYDKYSNYTDAMKKMNYKFLDEETGGIGEGSI